MNENYEDLNDYSYYFTDGSQVSTLFTTNMCNIEEVFLLRDYYERLAIFRKLEEAEQDKKDVNYDYKQYWDEIDKSIEELMQ